MFVFVMNSNQKGAIAESMIQAAAVELGVDVFRPVSGHSRADLIFVIGPSLYRVQVKWGRLSKAGDVVIVHVGGSYLTPDGYVHTSYAEHEVDLLAVYCAELRRSFLIPVSMFGGMKGIHLRLTPARNNQRSCTNLADDFEFRGAIAQLVERLNGIQEVDGSSPSSSTSLASAEASVTLIAADQLRDTLGQVIDQVAAGEEIVVTRRGQPRIRLLPAV